MSNDALFSPYNLFLHLCHFENSISFTMAPICIEDRRSVLILGGGSGIGLKAVEYLLSRTDCKVVVSTLVVSRECEVLQEVNQGRVWFLQGDVTNAEDRRTAVNSSVERMGGIDSVVYSAGLLYVQRCALADLDMVKKSFEVNVFGCMAVVGEHNPSNRHLLIHGFRQCQLALPFLRESSQRGRIIIISSGADHLIANCGWMPYCSSKAALSRFLQCLAHEEDETLVKIQGVYPRVTRTAIAANMIAGKYKGIMRDDEIEKFLVWEKEGNKVEPPEWCGTAVGMMAADTVEGTSHGMLEYYDQQVDSRDYKS
jgi:NAD(P)-dependent dehydrogenase (short-subunit alcohol dehydrogenase family)